MSFDAPQLYFGLMAGRTAQSMTIRWSTGEESEITGPLEPGRLYHITRAP